MIFWWVNVRQYGSVRRLQLHVHRSAGPPAALGHDVQVVRVRASMGWLFGAPVPRPACALSAAVTVLSYLAACR